MGDNNIIVGTLRTLLTADSAQLEEGMRKGSASVKKFTDDTSKQASTIEAWGGRIKTALAGAFALTAVVAAGKQVLDFADTMTNLAQKTGIGTTGLQKLQLAFESSGVSIDTVTKAAGELGARLVGDKGAAALVQKLGLNLEELKRMKPEDQLITVADVVGRIQNKGEQLYASKTLLGRGGPEMLAGLTGHLGETTKGFEDMGLIIDEQALKAADEFGDQLGVLGKQGMALIASVLTPFLPLLSMLAENLMQTGQIISKVLGPAVEWLVRIWLSASAAINHFIADVLEASQRIPILGKHLGIAGDGAEFFRGQADKLEKQLLKTFTATDDVASSAQAAVPPLLGLGDTVEKVGKKSEWTAAQLKAINAQMALFERSAEAVELFYAVVGQDMVLQNASKHVAEFVLPFKDLETNVTDKTAKISALMHGVTQSYDMFGKSGEEMAERQVSAFGRMFEGIQSVTQSLWDGMTGQKGFAGLMNSLGDGIVKGFGNILSGGLASVIQMGVNLAVQGIAKIGSLIAGLFKSEESSKVNKPRDQFFAQFGGYEGLASSLTEALGNQGDTDSGTHASELIRTLYDADTEAKFKSAQNAIAGVFGAGGRNIQTFDTGGMIGGAWDHVMIRAQPGESVLNRSATAALGKGGVDALNAGRQPVGSAGNDKLQRQLIRTLRELPRRNAQQLKAALAGT